MARREGAPPEYSTVRLSCAVTCNLDAVMVGWPDPAQDRLPAGSPDTQPRDPGIPRLRLRVDGPARRSRRRGQSTPATQPADEGQVHPRYMTGMPQVQSPGPGLRLRTTVTRGCRKSCRPMRPANIRGSGRRAGRGAARAYWSHPQADAHARRAGSAAAPGAAGQCCNGRRTRLGPAAGAVPR